VFIAFVNLAIFQQRGGAGDNDFSNRIANIATLLIAYAAYFPTIRSQIPVYSKILFVEVLVYLQILVNAFCILHSLIYKYDNEFPTWGGLFITSLVINCIIVVILVVLSLVYTFKWLP
jgi:hypothetical protein